MALLGQNTTKAYSHMHPSMATCFGLYQPIFRPIFSSRKYNRCALIVPSTGKYLSEDGLVKTETCSHTGVLVVVCFCCVSTEQNHFILNNAELLEYWLEGDCLQKFLGLVESVNVLLSFRSLSLSPSLPLTH